MDESIKFTDNVTDLIHAFRNLYTKGLHTDHQIIFKDAYQEIPLKVHRVYLIASCPYFEKIYAFGGKPIENPQVIIVEDALMAQKVIESFYGLKPIFESTSTILSFMIIRDFFSLANNYEDLLKLEYEDKDKALLLRVLYQFTPNDAIATLLNKIFFLEKPVTDNSIVTLKESGFDICERMAELMFLNDLRYDIMINTEGTQICSWRTHPDKIIEITKDDHSVFRVAYSYTGNIIAIIRDTSGQSSSKKLEIWCRYSGSLLKTINLTNSDTRHVCVSTDDTRIITGGYGNNLEIWDWSIDNPVSTVFNVKFIRSPTQHVLHIMYSYDGKYFIAVGQYFFNIYDASAFDFLVGIDRIQTQRRELVSLSNNGEYFAYSIHNKMIILSTPSFEPFLTIDFDETINTFNSASYSPDSKQIIIATNDYNIKIFDAINGQILHEITINNIIENISWPDDKCIIIATKDGYVNIFDASTYKILRKKKFEGNISSMRVYSL